MERYTQLNQIIIIFIEMKNVMREMYLTIEMLIANGACVKHHNGYGVVAVRNFHFMNLIVDNS